MRSAAISTPALHTTGLGKRYGSHWALQDCSLDIPQVTWAIAAAVAWGAALAALVYWWRAPENALSARFDSFDIQGVVPIAYAVFAVMVGLALGSLIRRPIPAIGATMVAFVALRAAVGVYLRPHFMTPVTVSTSVAVNGAAISVSPKGIPDNAWVINQFFTGPQGHASGSLHDLGLSCHGLAGYVACLSRHGLHAVTTYLPAGSGPFRVSSQRFS